LPSTYPSSVPSTSCCAPRSSTATTVACHIPPQLRFARRSLGLCPSLVTRVCSTVPRRVLVAAETASVRSSSLRGSRESSDSRTHDPLTCLLTAAETAMGRLIVGFLSMQQSNDHCLLGVSWICLLIAAETASCTRLFRRPPPATIGDFCVLTHSDLLAKCCRNSPVPALPSVLEHFRRDSCVLTHFRFACQVLPKQPRACASSVPLHRTRQIDSTKPLLLPNCRPAAAEAAASLRLVIALVLLESATLALRHVVVSPAHHCRNSDLPTGRLRDCPQQPHRPASANVTQKRPTAAETTASRPILTPTHTHH
jgi:hypothetical protein